VPASIKPLDAIHREFYQETGPNASKPRLPKQLRKAAFGVLGAWVFARVVGILFGVFGKLGSEGPPVWIFVILLIFAVLNGYMWLRFPFEIKLRDDTTVEFRSVFRRITVSPVDIKSVRA
jgi:hypothetical protein